MVIDIICLIFLAYGFWVGYSRGIITTVLGLASYVFGAVAALKFGPASGDMLQSFFPGAGGGTLYILGVILTFIVTLFLFRILAGALEGLLESANLNIINQAMGGLLSGAFFIFIFSVLISFADRSTLIDEPTKAESRTYAYLEPLPTMAWDAGQSVWPMVSEFWDRTMDALDSVKNNVETQESDSIFDLDE
ncbi:MAG: CvpA family protein [Saprospiraceae bacterium]